MVMNLSMTIRVEQHSVARPVLSAFAAPYQMMVMPSGEFGNLPAADWAIATLL
jgi:hypothetical protein